LSLRPILALLFAIATAVAAWREAPPLVDRPHRLLFEHEEGRAKRLAAAFAAAKRGPAGSLPPSVEGALNGYDVVSYDLSFSIDPANVYLEGRAVLRVAGIAPRTPAIALDFFDGYELTETSRDGHPLDPLSRAGGRLALPLDPPLRAEERTTLAVAFRGVPPTGGALTFWQHATGPAVGSISEPFGARDFFPCVDDPRDKAVVTIRVTVPPGMVAASSGLLTTADGPDGRRTFTWHLPQPIPTYLISLAVANYVTVEGSYVRLDGRTMPLISYVMPEDEALSRQKLAILGSQIGVFAPLFGEYPFADTKYGIAASHFEGGMEHPTMTAIGAVPLADPKWDVTLLLAHELSHQWWGDRVTMRTWDDIWLNEGFATYGEVLYLEKTQGRDPGVTLRTSYDDRLYGGVLSATVVADPADPFAHTSAVYYKGGWFLHMLRRLVGDDAFFSGLRAYGDAHAWGTATRGDLRALFEQRTGLDLKQFWDQWLETPFRPTFRATFRTSADASTVTLAVTQTQGHTVVHPAAGASDEPYYVFPLVVRLTYVDGTSADVTVVPTDFTTNVTIPNPSKKFVAGIALDPGSDILKVVESTGPG
jgi:aminopeptidase N